ncbi:MAG: Lrp/AsnC family transcriptional regulator [Desulfobacterales bacterium]|nr:Lrp/AsnC family transcriptional regulator [Desulfobacterales bacterium]
MNVNFDKIDSKIICLLQKDGRMPYKAIAKRMGISETNARTRTQRLIKDEIIQIVAVSDPEDLGYSITGTIKARVEMKKIDHVLEELKKVKEFVYIGLMTGNWDIDIEFIAQSINDVETLIYKRIVQIDGVIQTESSLTLRYVKDVLTWKTALE